MEFNLVTELSSYRALLTNIFSTNYLGMPNSHRMMLYVDGREDQLIDITKRVYELAICIIKYCGKTDSPYQDEAGYHKYSYHFSITGPHNALEEIRVKLGIFGMDIEEEIEDFDEPMDGACGMMGGLSIK